MYPNPRGIRKQSQFLHSWHISSHPETSRQWHALPGQSHLPASQPIPDASLKTNSIAASDFHYSQHCDSFRQDMGSLPEHSNGHGSPVGTYPRNSAQHLPHSTQTIYWCSTSQLGKDTERMMPNHHYFTIRIWLYLDFYQAGISKASPSPYLEVPPCCLQG